MKAEANLASLYSMLHHVTLYSLKTDTSEREVLDMRQNYSKHAHFFCTKGFISSG